MNFLCRSGLVIIACALPFSKFGLSLGLGIVAAGLLLEGNFKHRLRILKENPTILLFASLFLVYAIATAYSADLPQAWLSLRNTLPVLIIPLATGTSRGFSDRFTTLLLSLFVYAVVASAAAGMISYYFIQENMADPRDMSLFMNHIRFSLLVNMAIFTAIYLLAKSPHTQSGLWRYGLSGLCLIAFLIALGSLTGIILFIAGLIFTLTIHPWKAISRKLRLVSRVAIVVAAIILVAMVTGMYMRNFHAKPVDVQSLEQISPAGNPYTHRENPRELENGNYVHIYVNEEEMRDAWNRRSIIPYDSMDQSGQYISYTLMRYLASRDLRKDVSGVSALTPQDIASIEAGNANFRFANSSFLFKRIYETLWEIHIYEVSGYVNRHTFTQRLAFAFVASELIDDHPFIGMGTGDVMTAMVTKAAEMNMDFDENWEGKPHNQFLYYALAAGITGLVWILFSWIYPLIRTGLYRHYLMQILLLVFFISMFSMDTMEGMENIILFSFFYCLFTFSTALPDGSGNPAENAN